MLKQPGKDFYIKTNKFISLSRYDLGVWEQRILAYVLADTVNRYTNKTKGACDLRYTDISEIANLKDNSYSHIRKAMTSIKDQGVYVEDQYIPWFDSFSLDEFPNNDVCCIMQLAWDLDPYLFAEKDFTKIKIPCILNFRNKYSAKMHETIQMGIGKTNSNSKIKIAYHEYSIDIDFLRDILNLHDKYPTYADLKNSVLLLVQKDFDRVYNMGLLKYRFQFSENKRNRVVHSINIQAKGFLDNEYRITDDKKYQQKKIHLSRKDYR